MNTNKKTNYNNTSHKSLIRVGRRNVPLHFLILIIAFRFCCYAAVPFIGNNSGKSALEHRALFRAQWAWAKMATKSNWPPFIG